MKKIFFLLTLSVILLTSCAKDDTTLGVAKFDITNQVWSTTSYGSPQLEITVKNTGKNTGYNLDCIVTAKSGNTIIGTAHAYPGDLGDIKPNESAKDYAVFFNLTNTQLSAATLTISTTWLEK